MGEFITRFRFVLQGTIDGVAWLAAMFLAVFLRYELDVTKVDPVAVPVIAGVAILLQLVIGATVGLYVRRWRYGTFDEIKAAVGVVAIVTALTTLINLISPFGQRIPTSAVLSSAFIVIGMMCAARMVWRVLLERWTRNWSEDRFPVVVYGAGEGGEQALTAMFKAGPYEPVALIDDDPAKRRLRIKGMSVQGGRADLVDVARRNHAKHVVVAIPSASTAFLTELSNLAIESGLTLLVLPQAEDLLGGGVRVDDIKPLTEADLLGRRERNLDTAAIAQYITGKRVLVTGAGGSIGSELCRQIVKFDPAELVMLDRDETALQGVQLSIYGHGLLDDRNLVLCDIRDPIRLEAVFTEHEPQVVFHAAALKHLTLLQMHPDEGWKTNVWGSHNMLDVAARHGVERFVNVSTDKAAEPTSVLGETKRLAEQLTSQVGRTNDGTYLSVRFGNVLGSRGSVLPLFRAQIANGGPVTVTHPDATRFFMTIPEACQLVMQAGALGLNGQVLVLDMGEPVKIVDMARRLIDESGADIKIEFTGLRPGEKLDEVLFSENEAAHESGHDMIRAVEVPPLTVHEVAELDRERATISRRSRTLAP